MQAESIAECVKTAAETAMQESQFVYDAETGLYYDYVSGQYYDAVSTTALQCYQFQGEVCFLLCPSRGAEY